MGFMCGMWEIRARGSEGRMKGFMKELFLEVWKFLLQRVMEGMKKDVCTLSVILMEDG